MYFDETYRGGLQQTCLKCCEEGNAGLRAEWGCDAPLAEPWDHFDCPYCGGGQEPHADVCKACAGTGSFPVHRCPWQLIGHREAFVCRVVACAEVDLDPFGSGYAHWPWTLQAAFDIVGAARGRIVKAEQEGRAAAAAAKRGRRGRH